jgi:SigmaK-factor processing regulatory protein BofA.
VKTTVWASVLIGSLIMLAALFLRGKIKLRWFGYAVARVIVAAIVLYFVDATGLLGTYSVPINGATVAVVGILGLPGFAALAAMKWAVL